MNKELTNQEVVQKSLKTLCRISGEFQAAGGAVEHLSRFSLLEFIETCARNNIEIEVKYKRNN